MFKKLLATTSLRANVIANLVGSGWSALIGLIFVPQYLKHIGAEGYGLIGVFATLQVVLSLLDNGLSTTLNKELARLSALTDSAVPMRRLVRTLEVVYLGISAGAGLIAVALAPVMASRWVRPEKLSVETVTWAFVLLGISVAFQFPSGFYGGGLLGLQRQVLLNVQRVVFATLKSVGALLILMFVSPTVLAFFGWTLAVAVLQAVVLRITLWASLPKSDVPARFERDELKKVWRFAAGLTGLSLTSIALTQVDKTILSKMLTLEQFGYYSLAFSIGSIPYMLAGPVANSYFPKLSEALTRGDSGAFAALYHQACQLVTLAVVPFALTVAFFSREALQLWTRGDTVTVENTWRTASIVTLGVALHCLMYLPHMLSLAHENTSIALRTNLAIIAVLVPGTAVSAQYFGGIGAATCWLCVGVAYFCTYPTLIHRRFLPGASADWFWRDTLRPSLVAFLVVGLLHELVNKAAVALAVAVSLAATAGALSFMATLIASPDLLARLVATLRRGVSAK